LRPGAVDFGPSAFLDSSGRRGLIGRRWFVSRLAFPGTLRFLGRRGLHRLRSHPASLGYGPLRVGRQPERRETCAGRIRQAVEERSDRLDERVPDAPDSLGDLIDELGNASSMLFGKSSSATLTTMLKPLGFAS
jgi:hypothetical protein